MRNFAFNLINKYFKSKFATLSSLFKFKKTKNYLLMYNANKSF